MYKKILLCYDGTPTNRCALREGADLAVRLQAEAHVLAIVPAASLANSAALMSGACSTIEEEAYRRHAEAIAVQLRERGVRADSQVVFGRPIDQIPYIARMLSCDLVVVGHKSRRALGRWWAGGENVALADRTPCSVLISVESEAASVSVNRAGSFTATAS
jgi:nucleotide-binding universal stress UspA family protein